MLVIIGWISDLERSDRYEAFDIKDVNAPLPPPTKCRQLHNDNINVNSW